VWCWQIFGLEPHCNSAGGRSVRGGQYVRQSRRHTKAAPGLLGSLGINQKEGDVNGTINF
jgi:hypothetical protein